MQRSPPTSPTPVSEQALVRDVLYILQGIEGEWIRFSHDALSFQRLFLEPENLRGQLWPEPTSRPATEELGFADAGFSFSAHGFIPQPTKALLIQICELGWIFRILQSLIQEIRSGTPGLVQQSFLAAVQDELSDYLRAVAVLETHFLRSVASSEGSGCSGLIQKAGGGGEQEKEETQLSLHRLHVWIQTPLPRLRHLAILCDQARGTQGGALINTLLSHVRQGDRELRNLCKVMLVKVSVAGSVVLQPPSFSEERFPFLPPRSSYFHSFLHSSLRPSLDSFLPSSLSLFSLVNLSCP